MSKMTIADAALKLGVSKEAIHNRIRRGSLESLIEDGVKFVIIKPGSATPNKPTIKRTNTRRTHEPDARYYKLLEEQNEKLQIKVEKLEGETKTLRDQKEQMLILEREKIEQIYKDKDEQLKNILNAISSKFLLGTTPNGDLAIENEELVEAEIESEVEIEPKIKVELDIDTNTEEKIHSELISLKKYIRKSEFSKKKIKKIKNRFKKVAKKDSRIIMVGKKQYINPAKFDYSDLI